MAGVTTATIISSKANNQPIILADTKILPTQPSISPSPFLSASPSAIPNNKPTQQQIEMNNLIAKEQSNIKDLEGKNKELTTSILDLTQKIQEEINKEFYSPKNSYASNRMSYQAQLNSQQKLADINYKELKAAYARLSQLKAMQAGDYDYADQLGFESKIEGFTDAQNETNKLLEKLNDNLSN